MKQLLITLLTFLILAGLSCRNNEIILPPYQKPGKRDYVWTVDTLSYPGSYQTIMYAMWASSPKDVYVVGHNDRAGPGTIFHFDGIRWNTPRFHISEGGTISGGVSWSGIYGRSSQDVWIVGERIYDNPLPPPNFLDSGLVIHFNGSIWQEVSIPRREALTCIDGCTQGDIWAGGSRGAMLHFDGSQWGRFLLGDEFFMISVACVSPNDVYATGNREDVSFPIDSTAFMLFHYDGSSWQRVDSIMRTPGAPPAKFGLAVWSDNVHLYSVGPNVFRFEKNTWTQILEAQVGHMIKNNENNIFAVGDEIYHYNGIDWKELSQFKSTGAGWVGVYTDGNETFIAGVNYNLIPQRTIILHGK